MKKGIRSLWIVAAVCGVLLLESPLTFGQDPEPAATPATTPVQFAPEQIDQIAAPIALYPDALLAQVLMAATYPVELVKADRLMLSNPTLEGDVLEEALQAFDWDPSVKSLCAFRDVLHRLSENLDWTQDLGDAYLGQNVELMDSIQRLRKKAQEEGTLQSTAEQTVTVDQEAVVIEPTSGTVYVPTYYPSVIYPSPSYLYYPTLYVAPPPQAVRLTFAAGVVAGAAIWGHCDWHSHSCVVRVDHYNHYVGRTSVGAVAIHSPGPHAAWKHQPAHRRGVAYGSPAVAHHYGPPPGRPPVSHDQARGYNRPPGAPPRPPAASRPPSRPPAPPRPSPATTGSRGSAYSGSRQPAMEARASQRGAQVRSTPSRSGGAPMRSGGGSRPAAGGRGR